MKKYCPTCGTRLDYDESSHEFYCQQCGTTYYETDERDEYDRLADERADDIEDEDLPF